jgi:hypothetical protein
MSNDDQNYGADKVFRKLAQMRWLPAERETAVQDNIWSILNEAKEIKIALDEEETKPSIHRRLGLLRTELRKRALVLGRRRILEFGYSLVDQFIRLKVYYRLRMEQLRNRWSLATIRVRYHGARQFFLTLELCAGFKALRRSYPRALVFWRRSEARVKRMRDFGARSQKSYRKMLDTLEKMKSSYEQIHRSHINPFRLITYMLKLEAVWYGMDAIRLAAMIMSGVAVLLIAGLLHKYLEEKIENLNLWFLVLIPTSIALVELIVHKIMDRNFEQWAHNNLVRVNAWLAETKILIEVDEEVANHLGRQVFKGGLARGGTIARGDTAADVRADPSPVAREVYLPEGLRRPRTAPLNKRTGRHPTI